MHYGAGAAEVFREVVTSPGGRYKITSDSLRRGDVERALLEWRSLIRHIAAAPDLEWKRWQDLKSAAQKLIERSPSPAPSFFRRCWRLTAAPNELFSCCCS